MAVTTHTGGRHHVTGGVTGTVQEGAGQEAEADRLTAARDTTTADATTTRTDIGTFDQHQYLCSTRMSGTIHLH